MKKQVLAFDFGASSGRAILGTFDGEKITLQEIHRFSNDPVKVGNTFFWDVLRLFHEIKQGILKAKQFGKIESIGIDTWGVDFGLVDEKGYLLENPVHYRDDRNIGMIDEASKYMSKDEMYDRTGIQFMEFNTLFQLLSLRKNRPEMLERADKLLFMPDLLAYMLTGEKVAEYSIATTSQMVNISTQTWDKELLDTMGIPERILCDIVPAGTKTGVLRPELCEELGVDAVPVIAVCGHDTQSAITAIPSESKDFAFISSGTWSLFGTELDAPVVNDKAKRLNVTNEGGYGFTTAFLKNICGLWLIQESRRQWIREGKEYSYAELEQEALRAEPFKCFIDPDASDFVAMGDMPERVREFCRKTGQYVPETVGEVMRCIYESLAMKYKYVLAGIEDCTEKQYDRIHVMGGGTKDTFLCALTASSCNRTVYAGPIEATVLGNIAVQFMSANDIKDIAEARKIIAKGENLKVYNPVDADKWEEAYKDFVKIVK